MALDEVVAGDDDEVGLELIDILVLLSSERAEVLEDEALLVDLLEGEILEEVEEVFFVESFEVRLDFEFLSEEFIESLGEIEIEEPVSVKRVFFDLFREFLETLTEDFDLLEIFPLFGGLLPELLEVLDGFSEEFGSEFFADLLFAPPVSEHLSGLALLLADFDSESHEAGNGLEEAFFVRVSLEEKLRVVFGR